MKTIRRILRNLRQADEKFSLIHEKDNIAVGVSGGKDSLVLLRALKEYQYYGGKKFKLFPIFIDLGFGANPTYLKEYCASLGLSLTIDDSRFVYDVLKEHQGNDSHLPCSICSRMKKAAIANASKKLHCNVVAFAHHADDAIETMFMNMTHGSRVATFAPKMYLKRANVLFIRPLFLARESDISLMAKEENLPIMPSSCPADGYTEREEIKNFLENYYTKHPEAKENFISLLLNQDAFYLPFLSEELTWRNSAYSLKPIITAEDLRSTSFATRKKKEGESEFLVLQKNKVVGEILLTSLGRKRYEIKPYKGEEEALIFAIDFLMNKKAREENPLLFLLKGKKSLALKLGFEETIVQGKKSYRKRMNHGLTH